jgi:hypothetical protein
MVTDENKRCSVDTDNLEVSIKLKAEGLTWKEVLSQCIDCVRGFGFGSEELDSLYEDLLD